MTEQPFSWNPLNYLPAAASGRYRRLCRSLLVIMILITIIPVLITASLSFFQYRRLLQEETYMNAHWSAENSRQMIETFIEKLRAAILVVSDAYTFPELAQQERLDQVFVKLKAYHRGLVDLSVIGPDGVQKAYAGPYNLAGKDYSAVSWYTEALSRRLFVSEVFLGYRNIPHFVVTVSRPTTGGSWLLRASIDAKTLDEFLASVDSDLTEDLFLVTEQGVLQTTSRYHGTIHDQFPISHLPKKGRTVLLEQEQNDAPILRALGRIQGTPWVLVLDQPGYQHKKNWLAFKGQLWMIVIGCAVICGLIVIRIAVYLTNRIRTADEARQTALSQAEHTNKLASIGRLAAGVAHEINNPLAIINEKTGLMQDLLAMHPDFSGRDKFNQQLKAILAAVTRTKAITHRLLGFSRRMDSTLDLVRINELILEVLDFLEKEAIYRNITLDLNLDRQLPVIQGDQGQLQQVLLNIINNAFDAIGEDGKLSIVTSSSQDEVKIAISDDGAGMPPEVVKQIFEPFFTTKSGIASGKEREGTGLGLFIVYGIVKKLGGDIQVNSAVGSGSTFTLTFPVAHEQSEEHHGRH